MGLPLAIGLGTALLAGPAIKAGEKLAGVSPKTPSVPSPPLMPDQNSIMQSQQLEEAKAAALRSGRASTVLSQGPSGNTGDKLGP